MLKKLINKFIKPKKANQIQEGTVKFFNNTKGFGFITISDSEEEVFVHKTGLLGKIRENDKVIFEIEEGEKGPNAVNVKKA